MYETSDIHRGEKNMAHPIYKIFDTALTANDSTAKEVLGMLRFHNDGRIYRYIRAEDQNIAIGEVVYHASAVAEEWEVSTDYSGGSSVAVKVAGVAIGTITDAYYGWVQVSGYCPMVRTDAGVAAGEALIGHTVDGEADTMAAGEENLVFGYALADDATINSQDACIAQLCGII